MNTWWPEKWGAEPQVTNGPLRRALRRPPPEPPAVKLAREAADRAAWLEGIRQRLQLVTADGGMPPPPEPLVEVRPLPPYDPRPVVLTRDHFGHAGGTSAAVVGTLAAADRL